MKTLRATLLGVLFCAGMALVAMPATAAGGGETIECSVRDSESIVCNGDVIQAEEGGSLEERLRDWLDAELDRQFRPDEQLNRNSNGGGDDGGIGSGGGGGRRSGDTAGEAV